MIQITVIDRHRREHRLEAPTDMALNLMELCRAAELPVEGTCGGMALCASCHVYVEHAPEAAASLFTRTDDEETMFDMVFEVQENSRLGCQIVLTDSLEGLVVRLAPEQ